MQTFRIGPGATPLPVNGLAFKDNSLKRQPNKKLHLRKPTKAKEQDRRSCSLGSALAFGFISICLACVSLLDSRQGQKPVNPPILDMIDPNEGPMYAMTSQDEWCASIVNYYEPPEDFNLWPLMANLSLMSKAGTYNHKHLFFHPELIVRSLNSTGRTAFIICVTEPTLLLIVDFNTSLILMSKTDAACESTDAFRHSVVRAMRREPLSGMAFSLTRVGFFFLFRVQVNKETSRISVYLCKPTLSDQCESPLGRMSVRFSRLNIASTVVPVAMLYSEQDNMFMRSIKFNCKLTHNGKSMCWNPKTFSAEFCD